MAAAQDIDGDNPPPSSLWAMLVGKTHLEVRRPSPTSVEFTVTTQPRRTGWAGWAISTTVLAVRLFLALVAATTVRVWYQLQTAQNPNIPTVPSASDEGAQTIQYELVSLTGQTLSAAGLPPYVLVPLGALLFWASIARVHTSESLLVLRGLGIQTRSTGSTYLGGLMARISWVWWTVTSPWTLYRYVSGLAACVSGSTWAPTFWTAFDYEANPASTTRFIPTEQLQDLLVNEAFLGFEVRYYLVAIVAGGTGPLGGGDQQKGGDESSAASSRWGDTDDEDPVVVVFPRLLPGLDIVRTVWREARACLYEPPGDTGRFEKE